MLSSVRRLVPDHPGVAWRIDQQLIGHHERQVTDQDRHAFAEASRLAGPTGGRVGVGEHRVRRRRAAAADGVVHHVVVEQREGVHQLQGGAGVDDPLIVGVDHRRRRSPSDRTRDAAACRRPAPTGRCARIGSEQVFVERRPTRGFVVEQRCATCASTPAAMRASDGGGAAAGTPAG